MFILVAFFNIHPFFFENNKKKQFFYKKNEISADFDWNIHGFGHFGAPLGAPDFFTLFMPLSCRFPSFLERFGAQNYHLSKSRIWSKIFYKKKQISYKKKRRRFAPDRFYKKKRCFYKKKRDLRIYFVFFYKKLV